jgi:NADH dehydrogenase (ubiquinone) 1 alpha subcomplex subunit 9
MPETIGKVYELGGPNVYSMLEVYEVLYNIIEREPKIAYFNRGLALTIAEKILNWRHFNKEMILKHSDDMICQEGSN